MRNIKYYRQNGQDVFAIEKNNNNGGFNITFFEREIRTEIFDKERVGVILESMIEFFSEEINILQSKKAEELKKEEELQKKEDENMLWALAIKYGYELKKK